MNSTDCTKTAWMALWKKCLLQYKFIGSLRGSLSDASPRSANTAMQTDMDAICQQ